MITYNQLPSVTDLGMPNINIILPPGNITQDHTVISPAVAPGCCGVGIGVLSIGVSVGLTRVSQLSNSHYHEQEQNNSVKLASIAIIISSQIKTIKLIIKYEEFKILVVATNIGVSSQ